MIHWEEKMFLIALIAPIVYMSSIFIIHIASPFDLPYSSLASRSSDKPTQTSIIHSDHSFHHIIPVIFYPYQWRIFVLESIYALAEPSPYYLSNVSPKSHFFANLISYCLLHRSYQPLARNNAKNHDSPFIFNICFQSNSLCLLFWRQPN